jgi:hypothetical protein
LECGVGWEKGSMGGVVDGIVTCNYPKVITDTYTSPLWGFLIVIRTVILIFFRGPQGKGYGTRFCFSSKPTYPSFHRISPTAFHRSCMLNSNFQPPSLILTPKMQFAEHRMIFASNLPPHHGHERFQNTLFPRANVQHQRSEWLRSLFIELWLAGMGSHSQPQWRLGYRFPLEFTPEIPASLRGSSAKKSPENPQLSSWVSFLCQSWNNIRNPVEQTSRSQAPEYFKQMHDFTKVIVEQSDRW